MSEKNHSIAQILASLLDRVASNPRISQLTIEDKWFLLIETLLGHPPVNGFQRPADLPFSRIRHDAFKLFKMLEHESTHRNDTEEHEREKSPTIEFVLAYAILVNQENPSGRELERRVVDKHQIERDTGDFPQSD